MEASLEACEKEENVNDQNAQLLMEMSMQMTDDIYSGKARIFRDNIYPPLDSLWRYIRFLRT